MKKILFIMHLPPPVHGASIVGSYIKNSKILNSSFDSKYINLSASNKIDLVGKFSISKIFNSILTQFKILILIIKWKPDLCYLTPSSDGRGFYRDFFLVQGLKLFNCNLLLHFHNKAPKKWISKKINRFFLRIFFRKVKIILLGESLFFEKSPFIQLKDVYFCPNGVLSMYQNIIPSRNLSSVIRFLFLSNMMESKGVYLLLEACKILKDRNYEFKCDFVGGWKDISEFDFNKKADNFGLTTEVIAHGPKFNDDKLSFFDSADVFIFPTFYHGETFGLVLLEAMDASLPCISTDNGEIKNLIIDNITGFCVPQKSVQDLAEKMIWMIENPKERVSMGVQARKRFEEYYTVDVFENKLLEIFKDCLGD
jgi:glycosyltransferase involved in cell wall biosynthesis